MIALELPPLPAAEAELSGRVSAAIRREIERAGGWLPFDRYMSLALYAPGLGYYATGVHPLGRDGDYTTAAELSPVYGRCLAQAIAPVLTATGGEILELGAGSGRLAAEILGALARMKVRPARYWILELSAALREHQAATLNLALGAAASQIGWLDCLPARPWRGVAIASEVADALPVERFHVTGDGLEALGVEWIDGRFGWAPRPAAAPLAAAVAALETDLGRRLPAGYVSELAPAAGPWITALAEQLEAGVLYILDYGLPRREYYAPLRAGGTLACFFRHRVHGDPFLYPGLQDLTAWVDFTRLAEAGVASGLEVAAFTTQAQLLLATGFDRHLRDLTRERASLERHALTQAAATLVLPGEMGEKFKCLALARGSAAPLGFTLRDLAATL